MGKNLNKFLLLLWKNWKLQYRRPLQTTMEIIAPILFCILLVILRGKIDPEDYPVRIFEPFRTVHLHHFASYDNSSPPTLPLGNITILYSPSPNEELDRSMQLLRYTINIKGFKNTKALEKYASRQDVQPVVAIQLDDRLLNQKHIPVNLHLVLRMPAELKRLNQPFMYNDDPQTNTTEEDKGIPEIADDDLNYVGDWKTHVLFPMFLKPGPRDPDDNFGAQPGYLFEGFLIIQTLMTYVLAFGQLGITNLIPESLPTTPEILMQRFPHAAWREDVILSVMISFLGIIMMLSFVYTCINTVKVITVEKEKQLKEAMKIMGLPNWLHWTAWYIKTLSFLLISNIIMVILLRVPLYNENSIFTTSDPTLLFVFLLVYMSAVITFCFAISVFFSNANTAAAVAGLVWFLAYAPYLFLQRIYEDLGFTTKMIASLGFNSAMAYGFQLILVCEGIGEGMQWYNFTKPINPDDGLSLGLIMMMLIIDSLIYLLIALYVEAVLPGEYGTPMPWYFPFRYLYRCCRRSNVVGVDADCLSNEQLLSMKKPLIKISKLHKKFGNKIAIERLSLEIYDDEIMVLLGHNGAGKSTTMSILCGIIPPTSGTAIICDYDIRKNMKEIRANLGLCPQHNILFDDLTVREHLYFFSKLKGLSKIDTDLEIHKYVGLLDLEAKMNKKSSTLSGGMKRKLSVSIALCGNSKVVFLDEPTAGMDPGSRRHLWDLLQREKKGRCILLTTHYMDEADLLGDRIAIMASGQLKCCDTGFALKRKYGSGYHLILEKSPKCEPEKITKLLQQYIPKIQIESNIAYELSYLLPKEYVKVFEKMLENLEQNIQELGIMSYGISMSTLEEVFKKAGIDTRLQSNASLWSTSRNLPLIDDSAGLNVASSKRCQLILNQFQAMLMKKLLSLLRCWLLQLIQIAIPVVFLVIALLVNRFIISYENDDLPKLKLTLDSYNDPITLIEVDESTNYSRMYMDSLKPHRIDIVSNITNNMLRMTEEHPEVVKRKYLVGASFSKQSDSESFIVAWFNNDGYHTPPLALGLVLNVIYKIILGKQYSITFYNHPLPRSGKGKMKKLVTGRTFGFQLAFNVGFSMAFVSSFYILFYVRERVCKSKHLQFSSGVNGWIFWTSAYVCDLATFLITVLALIATLTCFQEEGYKTVTDLGRMLLIFFYFGFAMLPMMYWASYLFDIPATGYTRMTLFSVFSGVAAFVLIEILAAPGLDLKSTANALHWGLLAIPHYSLATGIKYNYVTYQSWKLCNDFVDKCVESWNTTKATCWKVACASIYYSRYCCDTRRDYFKWEEPGIGRNLLYSFLGGFVLFILLNLGEYQIWPNCSLFFRCKRITLETLEEDVLQESKIIHSLPQDQLLGIYTVVAKDLTKCYRKFLAVNGLCLGVKQYECFGLLGINGAGKTTTFKMLTGDLTISSGDAWINRFNLKTQLKEVQKVIGYCPQFDALLIDLTAKETLMMFALIRGIPRAQCRAVCEELAQEFDFYHHINKKVRHLSGGNKRKLSTAIALIGNPLVVCLDEPTAGMDPNTKRFLWDALCTLRDQGKCIVFTSHSMEECEALCTRLAIMVNGNFECLGSIQRLKSKFATGYSLSIKVKKPGKGATKNEDEMRKEVKKFVSEHFKLSILQEEHQELLVYRIHGKFNWSKIFGILERGKIEVEIEDYSVGQANLEQIFLNLTKYQR